jgi:hypothetical protein
MLMAMLDGKDLPEKRMLVKGTLHARSSTLGISRKYKPTTK